MKQNNPLQILSQSEETLLFPGGRVLMEDCSVIRDEKTGRNYVRFRFRQFSEKHLAAMLIDVACSDPWGNETERLTNVQFNDLNVNEKTPFGQTSPVPLTDENSRRFSVVLRQLAYKDGSILSPEETGEPLQSKTKLEDHFSRDALLEQYRKETAPAAVYLPFEQKSVRSCCCGALYRSSEDRCPVCGVGFDASVSLLSETILEEHIAAAEREREEALAKQREAKAEEERLSAERARREAEEKEKEAAVLRGKKRKLLRRIAVAAGAAAAVTGIVLAMLLYVIPSSRCKKGAEALSQGEYDEAIACFSAAGSFQDAEAQLQEAKYEKAASLMETESFSEAKELFDSLGTYRDSKKLAEQSGAEALYQDGERLLEEKKYEEAAAKFEQAARRKPEAADRLREARYLFGGELLEKKKYPEAEEQFLLSEGWEDAAEKIKEAKYLYAADQSDKKEYETAYRVFSELAGYQDADTRMKEAAYQYASQMLDKKEWQIAVGLLEQIVPYAESAALLKEAKYKYVLEHKNATDPVTHDYLEALNKDNYRDSASIYAALYPENVKTKDAEIRTIAVYAAGVYQITPDVGVNIRQSPGANNKKIGKYEYGQRVSVYEVLGNWGRTDTGWICLDYAKKVGDLYSGRTTGYYMVSDPEGLNIRTLPSVSSEKVGLYTYKTVVYVYEISGDWGRTEKGWIYLYYTKKQ